ncbi:MAG: hypothetical protein IKB74_05490 [Lentisphaeria bacterium]|nr:hypothetical protein [Lentisphaeria bacterium]
MNEDDILEQQSEIPAEPTVTPESEKLARLEEEYAALQKKYALLQQRSIVEKICFESGCADPDYLEFSAAKHGVDLCNAEALRAFAREFSAVSPGCFHARITPGSSAGNVVKNDSSAAKAEENFTADRIGLIALSIDNAPDAVSR